jgi:hypothetical protein
MDDLSTWVSTQNVLRFTDQMRLETDVAKRQQIQQLLVDEEDRLGFRQEQLENVENAIADGHRRIAFQREKIAALERSGRDAAIAQSLLENLIQVQNVHQQYRLTILAALGRNRT